MTLTKKQSEILDFIRSFSTDRGFQPSFREIQSKFGFRSLGTVVSHINALKTKGYVKKKEKKWRSLEVHVNETASLETPLVGSISKGKPLEMFSTPSSCSFPHLPHPETLYAFVIKDDSFQSDAFCKGDILAIDPHAELQDGDTALIGFEKEGLLIGKYIRTEEGVFLQNGPESILKKIHEFTFCGKLIALLRKYL